MEIYTKFDTVRTNKHYLKRYIKFVKNCIVPENSYFEKHHILPRSIFPQFSKESWNIVNLTYNQHRIAHKILCKVFTSTKNIYKMRTAAHNMNCISDKERSEYYKSEYFLSTRKQNGLRKRNIGLSDREKEQYSNFKNIVRDNWKNLSEEERQSKYTPGLENMNSRVKCIYCGIETNKGNIGRYHNERCKKKESIKLPI